MHELSSDVLMYALFPFLGLRSIYNVALCGRRFFRDVISFFLDPSEINKRAYESVKKFYLRAFRINSRFLRMLRTQDLFLRGVFAFKNLLHHYDGMDKPYEHFKNTIRLCYTEEFTWNERDFYSRIFVEFARYSYIDICRCLLCEEKLVDLKFENYRCLRAACKQKKNVEMVKFLFRNAVDGVQNMKELISPIKLCVENDDSESFGYMIETQPRTYHLFPELMSTVVMSGSRKCLVEILRFVTMGRDQFLRCVVQDMLPFSSSGPKLWISALRSRISSKCFEGNTTTEEDDSPLGWDGIDEDLRKWETSSGNLQMRVEKVKHGELSIVFTFEHIVKIRDARYYRNARWAVTYGGTKTKIYELAARVEFYCREGLGSVLKDTLDGTTFKFE